MGAKRRGSRIGVVGLGYVGLPLAQRLQLVEEVDEATTQLRPLPSIKEVGWNSDIA